MDAKDLRTESAVSERNNDGSKYSQSGGIALHCDRNKSYQDIGSNSLGKVDVPNARPCAVIGPDRVVPPTPASEAYHIKKGPAEPWPCMDNTYRRPPEYPHKLTNFQNPTRNISPRQTFQENMQRIMVPPTYNSIKVNDDTNYAQVSDRSNGLSKNIKLNMPPEAKFCEVPYAVNPTNNELKNIRNPEMCLPSVNPTHTRTAPHGWPPGSINLRSTRIYGAPELYQYQDYPSCAGPRPVVPRPHRTVPEEQGYVYADPYYQEGNIRFKPYPSAKERYPQQRYEYIGNYSNPFHPPPGFPSHKYEVQKTMPPHPYPPYPPIKYLDSRIAEPVMEGYQRNPQGLGPNFNIQYRSQVIHPNFGPVVGNNPQNKMHSYPPDAHMKSIPPNKLPYDNNTKTYIEYENSRPKIYPSSESYYVNEMARMPMKSQVIMPNYSTLNMHNMPPNPYYKKDAQHLKNYEHMAHFRNIDPNLNIHNPMSRHAPVFSPNTLAISPTDSNTSNDTTQTLGTSQEDCGYVSQSSTASVRSIDSGISRIPNEYLRKYYDNRYGPIVRTSPMMSKSQLNSNNNASKDKKQIDVRQFFQMWNEGDEEQEENSSKEKVVQTSSSDKTNFSKSHSHEAMNSQEQLYVLGLVNVPSEELAKYEHIQKVSKLPENIKGYNSIELLNQFEEVIESSHMSNYKTPTPKESMYHSNMSMKGAHLKQATGVIPPRPVSPLDVEAKISQSVIHKEVGCNFEIKPCSPKMLNVEVAAPVQNILAERSIEKVANQVMLKSPMLNNGMNENNDCNMIKRTDHRMNINENLRIPSCKMINTQFSNSNTIDPMKSSYSIQDLESNSGLCLASLPRLDNDIELNFPEVNQQFINANKGDSTVLTTSIRDLPTLEVLDQSPNQIKDKYNNTNQSRPEKDVDRSPYMVDPEKEFSKLSKYRKSKTNSFEPKETRMQQNVNAFRTDSVIIKNPENIKNHEESADFSNSLNKVIVDIQQAPINLTAQGSVLDNIESQPGNIDLQDAVKEKHLPVEIAIDFSLNKTGVFSSTEYMETKIESQMNTLIHIEENPLNKLNKDDSSDSISLLPVYTEENENLSNMDNLDENCSLDHKKDGMDVTESIAEINKKYNEADFKEILRINESCLKIGIEINKSTLNGTEEKIVSSVLTTSKTGISGNDLMSNNNSENCEKENCEDLTTDESVEDVNYTSAETESDISQNPTESLEEKYEMELTENTTNVAIDENFGDSQTLVDNLNSPIQTKTKLKNETSEINNSSETNDPVVPEQTQPYNINDNKLLLSSDETCCNKYESPDLIPSQNTNSESHAVSKDMMDHIKDDKDDSSTQSSEELSDHENELKDFDEDTLSSTENTDRCDIDQSADEDPKHQCDEPFRSLWYGSKELYSPWIQKLLTFSEGRCNNATTKNDMDSNNDVLVDSMEIVNTAAENSDDHNDFDCDLKIKPSEVSLEEVSHENVTEDMNKEHDNSNDTVKEIVDTSVLSPHSVDNNIDETINSEDRFECEDSTEDEAINNNENEHAVDEVDDIVALGTPLVTCEFNETDVIDSLKPDSNENIEINSDTQVNSAIEIQCEVPDTSNIEELLCESIQEETEPCDEQPEDILCESVQEETEHCDEQPEDKHAELESSANFEQVRFSFNGLQANDVSHKKCQRLKRSLSDSALNMYNDERSKQVNDENVQYIWPYKRRKVNNVDNDLLARNLCNIIHNNRRNSVSSFYNEDVSFCILIDDSCIITEEESDEPEKVCYTELSEECLVEIQSNCTKHDEDIETLTDIASSPQQENACEYSDSVVLDCEEDKTLEGSWDEDVGCVETVISDDIAEDIEICEISSPKDDALSDNDESGVFSSSEHTDKVKFIYGDKMCNDDALFVETLYKTPQMDVNKTLYNRETRVSEEYDRYYDNDSLEKMLSESNERPVSPYVPQYMDTMFPSGKVNSKETPEKRENVDTKTFHPFQGKGNALDIIVDINAGKANSKETPENKENMDIEPFHPFQSKGNALDIVVDINVDKVERENMHSIEIFAKARDDAVHSYETSGDNVFTFNQKDEDAVYTSSSPEVSSTTSEEKSSGILLKITNYKGSRISQINDISSVNKRSSCKFTEEKDYLHSHANYSSHRPLLTKAAQKYIPPLKESIRDLKVKLSLPQHSLMKLKQLKISKDEPKVNQQNATIPRIPKKPKPKFEDVLKSIDEIQFKKHKEKAKKTKKAIPKVVIKKNLNGSHYASTSNKDDFNPDLTGRKWQPWVFIEKNNFIDKMATRKKTQAIYSHRKRTYVLAEKFQKYKSASSAKFVISPPVSDNPSSGLKYTIRLKHNY